MKKANLWPLFAASLMLAVVGLGPVFAGGGAQRASSTPAVNEAALLNPLGQIPLAKEKINLKIGMVRTPVIEDWTTNYLTRELEKDSNIHLEFVFYGASEAEAKQKLELEFVAGGMDLPDIINMSFDAASAQHYGEQGLLLQLDDYVRNSIAYSKKSIDELGYDPWRYVQSSNGHIYTLFRTQQEYASDISTRLYTNKAWMRELGKGMPQSTAEFEELLRAFKNHRFNTGAVKEYPFIADKGTALSYRLFNALITPFVFASSADNYLYKDNSGQISAAYASEGWRQALIWIRGMVDEGLIDPLSFTQDAEQLKAIANSTTGYNIGMTTSYPVAWYGVTDPRSSEWVLIEPLTGPDGKRVAPFSGIHIWSHYAVSKNCKYPEAAFRLGDMLMSEKYSMISRYGEEGVDRVPPPAGSKSYYPGYEVSSIPKLPYYTPNNKRWEQNQPYILTYRMTAGVAVQGLISGLEEWANNLAAAAIPYWDKDREIGPINFTTGEFETISEIRANVEAYWLECLTRFVIRDMSLENDWNRYLGELRAMGLDTYINVVRTAYARMPK
jgi:putative aldouronate transport system substrate-binding protein